MSLLYFRGGMYVPFNNGLMSKNLPHRIGRVHSHGRIISIIRGNCNATIVLEWTCGLPIVYDLQDNSIVSLSDRGEISSSKTDIWTSWGINRRCCRMYTFSVSTNLISPLMGGDHVYMWYWYRYCLRFYDFRVILLNYSDGVVFFCVSFHS